MRQPWIRAGIQGLPGSGATPAIKEIMPSLIFQGMSIILTTAAAETDDRRSLRAILPAKNLPWNK
jgi:hypothetical protein